MSLRGLDRSFILLSGLAVLLIVTMLAIIVGNVVWHGWEPISWEFLSGAPRMGMTEGGIFPAIFGTVLLVLLMTIFVVPLGVCVAIYFSEYANRQSWLYRWTRQAVNNLAGVPSIVFGLFGLGFFVQFVGGWVDQQFYEGKLTYGQPAILWAALTMAVLTLPVVIVSVEEALRSVPQSYREASYALGATRTQTVFRVVLPQALAGVLTGGILAVSRGAGEVAPILFVGAAYYLPELPKRLNDQFMELGYHIYVLATQSPDVEATKSLLYATVLVLLALTFLLNLTAITIRARLRVTGGLR
ncbi:MAG: phosphate ABC transporter permease PstA [Firmicutes bacterium]|nr:phosphate ABC transporter permease PstA [Bacillota bacterium]